MPGLTYTYPSVLRARTPLTCLRHISVPVRTCSRRVVETTARPSSSLGSETVDDLIESDFYSILGVSPQADRRSIKQAYYNIMREYHPDSGADSTDFCAMLNDIYATLSDPCKRSVYNDMAGFSDNAINPFVDASAERDLVGLWMTPPGCTNCCAVCPVTFAMEDHWGRARVMEQKVDSDEKLQEAIDTCPVSCIHWVTANQIPLLETAMTKMERSPVWVLMSGGGRMEDVFSEASLAWAKRQSSLRQQIHIAKTDRSSTGTKSHGSSWWSWSNPFVDMAGASGASRYKQPSSSYSSYDSADDARGSYSGGSTDDESTCDPVGPRGARDIAGLAARASRTARTWKKYQEVLRNARGGKRVMLPDASR